MIKKIKFLDLSIQKKNDKKIYKEEFEKFINKGIYILGKDVKKFERNISKKTNNKYSKLLVSCILLSINFIQFLKDSLNIQL